jgi:hypothetical protein
MIDHTEVIKIVNGTCYGDKIMDLHKMHYGSIICPAGHTGDIGFIAGAVLPLNMSNMAVDGSLFRLQVTARAASLNAYPLPPLLFNNAYAAIWTQIGSAARTQTADRSYFITLKE